MRRNSLVLITMTMLIIMAVVSVLWLTFRGRILPRSLDNVVNTRVAGTVEAQSTLSAGATAVAQLTQIAQQPSFTPTTNVEVIPTAAPTLAATSTPLPAATFTPSITPVPEAPCDWLGFIGDVTIPDGSDLTPGQAFVKTWRVKNIGSCIWTTQYALVFTGGTLMGQVEVSLTANVFPGQTVDLSVDMTAPSDAGHYISYYMLRNAAGVLFGFGGQQDSPIWTSISVNQNNQVEYPITSENVCNLEWVSSKGTITCPSQDMDTVNGTVVVLNDVVLEGGIVQTEDTLLTIPSDGPGGFLFGRTIPIAVSQGDRFEATIGCLDGAVNCNVMFMLNYGIDGGDPINILTWIQTHDGYSEKVSVDLSFLAGQTVQFYLIANNYDNDSKDDLAFWVLPRLVTYR